MERKTDLRVIKTRKAIKDTSYQEFSDKFFMAMLQHNRARHNPYANFSQTSTAPPDLRRSSPSLLSFRASGFLSSIRALLTVQQNRRSASPVKPGNADRLHYHYLFFQLLFQQCVQNAAHIRNHGIIGKAENRSIWISIYCNHHGVTLDSLCELNSPGDSKGKAHFWPDYST